MTRNDLTADVPGVAPPVTDAVAWPHARCTGCGTVHLDRSLAYGTDGARLCDACAGTPPRRCVSCRSRSCSC